MNVQELEQLLRDFLQEIQRVLETGEELSDEFQGEIAETLRTLSDRIDEARAAQEVPEVPEVIESPPVEPPGAPPPEGPQLGAPPAGELQLLWILAGQNEQAFLQYLTSYPSEVTQALLQNPGELERVITFLQTMMPEGPNPNQADGVPHADLNSSNIYGYRYNPKDKKLKVRFQGGSVYEYDAVPANIFNAFSKGAAAARTNGQNQYGRWWVGKNPSLGAAFWNYIRNSGYNYRRLR